MELIKKTVKVGNSAGVILPKKLLGSYVKITVVKMLLNIKKEALKLLEPYFEDILGIYILNKNPIEILAITGNIKKIIKNEKLKISMVPFSTIKQDIRKPRLKEKIIRAETILNKALLLDLKKEIRG